MPTKKYVVSACLAGVNCRYDGKNNAHQGVMDLVRQGRAILVCPEQLGGMETPRAPSEIQMQDLVSNDSSSCGTTNPSKRQVLQKPDDTPATLIDVTEPFHRGAHEALNIAMLAGCTHAVLKAKSPSCGCNIIYDGTFTKTKVAGNGIFAQAAIDAGITVWTEETWPEDTCVKDTCTKE